MNENKDGIEYLESCPSCDSENLTVLQSEEKYKAFITGADEMIITTGVCGCEQCGLTFLNPRMGQHKLFEYYSKQSRIPRESIEAISPLYNLMELQVDLIEKFKPIKQNMRALEIGCAEGFFLQCLGRRANDKLELYGVELSKKYIEQAKKLLPNMKIYETPLEKTDFGELQFDLVILRHVFEHLADPMECLKKIRSILAPQGILYIEVPDSENIEPSITRFYHHEHLLYFTSEILNSCLISAGFQPLVCERFDANPMGSGFSYPVLRAVSVEGKSTDLSTYPGYAKKNYLENKMRNDAKIESLLAPIRMRLRELNEIKLNIGLFGAGPHTMDLLEIFEVENIQWAKIFDNNPSKQGKLMRGIPILKPDEDNLKSLDCVLVSSAEFESEMVAQVHSLVGSQVEVITIYANN